MTRDPGRHSTRLSVLFVAAILIPGCVLAYFSIQNARSQKELAEQRLLEEEERLATELRCMGNPGKGRQFRPVEVQPERFRSAAARTIRDIPIRRFLRMGDSSFSLLIRLMARSKNSQLDWLLNLEHSLGLRMERGSPSLLPRAETSNSG